MKKRLLSILLIICCVATSGLTLTGCKKQQYDITVWYPKMTDQYNNLNDTQVFQELERRTGIRVRYIIEDSSNFTNIFNSNSYPDVIFQTGQSNYPGGIDAAVREGKFIDLKPYIDEFAPNYKALIESNPNIYREAFVNDGKIGAMYAITNDVQGPWFGYMMRKDWIDLYVEAQNPTWETYPITYDDWEDFLMYVKTELGVSTPLFLANTGVDVFNGLNAGYNVGNSFYQVDGTVKYGPIEPEFKQYVEKMRSWYEMGLIKADFNANEQVVPEIVDITGLQNTDGNYAAFPHVYTYISNFENTARTFRPDTDFQLIGVPNPVMTAGDQLHLRQTNVHTGMAVSVSDKCRDIETVMRWLDYMYSPEGTILLNYGIEGDTFTYVDGVPTFTDKVINNSSLSVTQALYKYVAHSWTFNVDWRRELHGVSAESIAAMETWESNNDGAYLLHPNVALNAQESQVFTNAITSITSFVEEEVSKYIRGTNNMANYDSSFVNTLTNSLNVPNVISAYQSALDRYLSNTIT